MRILEAVVGERRSGIRREFGDSSPISTTIHSKELISRQLGQIPGATGRTRPVPIPLGRTHWSSTTSGTQDSVEIREESLNLHENTRKTHDLAPRAEMKS